MRLLVNFVCVTLCLAVEPQSFEARKAHVRELLQHEDFRAALEQAKSINREWADDIGTYQLMAAAHIGLGNYAEAESALQWMLDLRLGKTDPEGWRLVALFREMTGDIDGALEAASEAYRRSGPGQTQTGRVLLQYVCHLYVASGKPMVAEKALTQTGGPASESLAEVLFAKGKTEEAVATLRDLARSNPHPRYLYQIAEATKQSSDFERFASSARERMDRSDNANRELILYLSGPGKSAPEAVALCRREYDRRHDVHTADACAVALYAAGQADEARSLMEKTLAVGTRDAVILRHAAAMGLKVER